MARLRPTLPVSKLRCHTIAIACSLCLAQVLVGSESPETERMSDEEFLKSFDTQLFPQKKTSDVAPRRTPQETRDSLLKILEHRENSSLPLAISAFVKAIEDSPEFQIEQNLQRKAKIVVSTRSLQELAKILERSPNNDDQTIPNIAALLKHIESLLPIPPTTQVISSRLAS